MTDKILIVDDQPANLDILSQELEDRGYAIDTASNGRAALDKLDASKPDLVILDYMMPGLSGLDVLKKIRDWGNGIPVVIITAHGTVDRAVQAMKEGAYDFITRPVDPEHLTLVVRKALERQTLERGVEILSEEVEERYRLVVGQNSEMRQAIELARKVAASRTTVLLLGESGTGKEVFAHAIHNWSDRKDKPFVAINSVGLSKDLLESELFGHEQGAFTGAHRLKKGKMELAHQGTVFLDEIGDISPELQTKLLRFLEEREFERVGGTRSISVDIRIIAATNRDLQAQVRDGAFREDLYHRLHVFPITLPPLRERKEDIPVLAQYFLRKYSRDTGKTFHGIATEAENKLLAYDWPGNVRELANVIERAAILTSGSEITLEDLPEIIRETKRTVVSQDLTLFEATSAFRREMIVTALARANGNRAAAARALGLDRKYFGKLLKSLEID